MKTIEKELFTIHLIVDLLVLDIPDHVAPLGRPVEKLISFRFFMFVFHDSPADVRIIQEYKLITNILHVSILRRMKRSISFGLPVAPRFSVSS